VRHCLTQMLKSARWLVCWHEHSILVRPMDPDEGVRPRLFRPLFSPSCAPFSPEHSPKLLIQTPSAARPPPDSTYAATGVSPPTPAHLSHLIHSPRRPPPTRSRSPFSLRRSSPSPLRPWIPMKLIAGCEELALAHRDSASLSYICFPVCSRSCPLSHLRLDVPQRCLPLSDFPLAVFLHPDLQPDVGRRQGL
jgi:hypothetical protein